MSLTAVLPPPLDSLLPCSPRGRRSSPAGSQAQPAAAAAVCKGAGGSSRAAGRGAAENRGEQPSCGGAGGLPGSVLPAVGWMMGLLGADACCRRALHRPAASQRCAGRLLSHAVPPHCSPCACRRLPPRQRRLLRPSACGRSSSARRRCSSCWKVSNSLPCLRVNACGLLSQERTGCCPCAASPFTGSSCSGLAAPAPAPALLVAAYCCQSLTALMLPHRGVVAASLPPTLVYTSLPPHCCPCRRGAGGGQEAP